MKYLSTDSAEFKQYGCKVDFPYVDYLCKKAKDITMPDQGCSYMASVPSFESDQIKSYFYNYFGQMEVQVGYCYGFNNKLNALEWHKSSEVNVALTDFVLMLGDVREVENDGLFDTKNVKCFMVKKGEAVEIYANTLHFCPASPLEKSFQNVVILPKGTNTPLDRDCDDKRLTHKNKWLVCHPNSEKHVKMGRVVGIKGENLTI